MGAEEALAQALTKALHETETSGGWWGHPECEEFGRLIAPRLIRAGYHCNTDAQENWEHYRWLADQRLAIIERVRTAIDEGNVRRETGVTVALRVLAALDSEEAHGG